MNKDYYEVLGVSKDASQDEIKKNIENFRYNTTPTEVVTQKNSKKSMKHMKTLETTRIETNMIERNRIHLQTVISILKISLV